MALLCVQIDPDAAEEIRALYRELRTRADAPAGSAGVAQPATDSLRGALTKGSLLADTDRVRKTPQTRKVTYDGKTVLYPVYQVRIDALFYNDQNDRIATWLSRYEAEHGRGALAALDTDA